MKKEMVYEYSDKDAQLTSQGEIKKVLERIFHMSKKEISRLKWQGKILKNGKQAYVNEHLSNGDRLTIEFIDKKIRDVHHIKRDLECVYEDEDIIVVNKPAGIPTHPSKNHQEDSLGTIVQSYYYQKGQNFVIRAIGRLDKNVSGAVLFAKNQPCARRLSKSQENHSFQKYYVAICENELKETCGVVEQPILKVLNSKKRIISDEGVYAKTYYRMVGSFHVDEKVYSLVLLKLETGRTHQIRLHMSSLGNPIIGDSMYESCVSWKDQIALHCYCMSFCNPFDQTNHVVKAEMPSYMLELIPLDLQEKLKDDLNKFHC